MDIQFDNTTITHFAIHEVGNKLLEISNKLQKDEIELDDNLAESLLRYSIRPFMNRKDFNRFVHFENLNFNIGYASIKKYFQGKSSFMEWSEAMSLLLYENTKHPNIKQNEVFFVSYDDLLVNNKRTNAVGIFKIADKDYFLNSYKTSKKMHLTLQEGVNIDKLQKGTIIINEEEADGYYVLHINNVRGEDAQYWVNDFLNIKPRQVEFNQTTAYLKMCKEFVVDHLPGAVDVERTQQIDLLNKSVNYFKENEAFETDAFVQSVFDKPIAKAFEKFKKEYEESHPEVVADNFSISGEAVKKQNRHFKSVLKLDKNFHIYVHGDKTLIENGFDQDKGMKYYKVYYKEEN